MILTPPGGGGKLSQYKCDLQENEVVFCNPEEEGTILSYIYDGG